jgi:UDP-3-O-[3-hydroxymyristoyl] glucosamine N-acyltransferase
MTDRTTTLGQLAEWVGGKAVGDPATPIHGAAGLGEAEAGQITLVDHPDRLKQLTATQAAAVVISENIECAWPAAIVVSDVHAAFARIVSHFRPPRPQAAIGVSPQAVVSSTARCAASVTIHAGATVGDDCDLGEGTVICPGAHLLPGCRIGRQVTIGPGAILYENTVVGDRSIIQGGAVLGAHGFGYTQVDGRHVPAAQLGHVHIGSDVEIGACTTIDRGTYGATSIGNGTKIDNLVQIAHNCRIGRHNLICSQVGIAGSTTTGDYVVMGGQAGVRDHVHIGSGAMLSAMAGITNDVPDGAVMMGIPATPEREQKLKQAALAKLPEMRQEFKALRRAVAELEKAKVGASRISREDAAGFDEVSATRPLGAAAKLVKAFRVSESSIWVARPELPAMGVVVGRPVGTAGQACSGTQRATRFETWPSITMSLKSAPWSDASACWRRGAVSRCWSPKRCAARTSM